ncbi:GTPase HflX [Chondromyces crocatus]|uniref:GTPase HflX n=1 Tax=Chondromyces crocatus TaxID=52 RepID=A0A0K1ENT2_CHOCO|nr:GTPase HflX [Chondromyces crocatus]AKT42484.1 GTP-binding protein [Chondromyces crocatus]
MAKRSDRSRSDHHPVHRPLHSQRALVIAVQRPEQPDAEVSRSLGELVRLAGSLGIHVVQRVVQRRLGASATSLVGEGKLRELAALTGGPGEVHPGPKAAGPPSVEPEVPPVVDVVLVDAELTPGQQRHLGIALGVDVLDRTAIILRVFELHARTREAMLQVEMARLHHEAPRIRDDTGLGDREGGGGRGGRGHSNVELRKQRHRARIGALQRELSVVKAQRAMQRARRQDMRRVALVGYTNAGKSSLMRGLTGSDVLVEDKLFATLGTTIRALQPPANPPILVADTVGFIEHLPHALIESFRSTLDEVHEASLLLFVVDASDPAFETQLSVTRQVVDELGAAQIPAKVLLNKIDRLDDLERAALEEQFPDALAISAHDPADVRRLREEVIRFFEGKMTTAQVCVPYQLARVFAGLRQELQVLTEEYGETGILLTLRASPEVLARLEHRLAQHEEVA